MIEALNPDEPWEISIGATWNDHTRELEARDHGRPVMRWVSYDGRIWRWKDRPHYREGYGYIVMTCLNNGWSLYSLPASPAEAPTRDDTENPDRTSEKP